MRRRLTLLRHGHALQSADDFDRPLSAAGRVAAARAGEALARSGFIPDYVVSSAAPRALGTAELAARACGYPGSIQVERALYLASDAQYLAALHRLPDGARSVLLVGHNPGLSRLARDVCGHAGDLDPAEFASAELELDDWAVL